MNKLLIFGITILILCTIVAILYFCVRIIKLRRKHCDQFYIVENSTYASNKTSLLDIANSFSTYRKYNNVEQSGISFHSERSEIDPELVDSTDFSNKFHNSLLRLNSNPNEMQSSISNDSLGTYFSTNTAQSRRSFVSCLEGSDDETARK